MQRTSIIYLLLLSLILNACSLFKKKSPILATVGDYNISLEDAQLRDKVIQFYSPGESRKLGLLQLIQAYTLAQTLKQNNFEVTEKILKTEEERIDKSTLMPEKLIEIKKIFGLDFDAYRRIFILPVYVNRVTYYEFWLHNAELQKENLQKAHAFIAAAKTKTFSAAAKTAGFQVSKFTVNLFEGIKWLNTDKNKKDRPDAPADSSEKSPEQTKVTNMLKQKQDRQKNEEAKKWIDDIISKLKIGEIHPIPIDNHESIQVVQVTKKLGFEYYELDSVSFPKDGYGKWLEDEKAKFKILSVDTY